MANTTKAPSKNDYEQIFKNAANDTDKSIAVSGFVNAKVGHRVARTAVNATTDDYSYFDGATLLMTIRVIYTTSGKTEIDSVERTA